MSDLWIVEEFKVWKGIDRNSPVWNTRGFISDKKQNMDDIAEYLQHNCPELKLRVVRHGSQSNGDKT